MATVSSAVDALRDGPVHGVDQVVVHRLAPLQIAGVDERLAEAGGAPEVDLQHGVAAVGQQLGDAVERVGVARPGSAVDQQHHRHRLARDAVAVGVDPGGQRQIGDQVDTVTSRDDMGRRRGEPVSVESRPRVEEQAERLVGPVVGVVAGRGRRDRRNRGSTCRWRGSARGSHVTVELLAERLDIRLPPPRRARSTPSGCT